MGDKMTEILLNAIAEAGRDINEMSPEERDKCMDDTILKLAEQGVFRLTNSEDGQTLIELGDMGANSKNKHDNRLLAPSHQKLPC